MSDLQLMLVDKGDVQSLVYVGNFFKVAWPNTSETGLTKR